MFEWIKALLILPFNVIVIIPSLILTFSNYTYTKPNILYWIIGILLLIFGVSLFIWTIVLFNNLGKGTLAPWNPPKALITCGPYSYIRNPMIVGIMLILTAEYFLSNSMHIIWWIIIFFTANNIYFYLFEEKQLEKNFGKDYIQYKNNVPRWLPKYFKLKQK